MSYEGSAHIQAVRAYLGQLQGTPTEADLKTVMGLLAQSVDKTPKDLIALTSRRKRVAAKSIVSSAGSGSAAASTASDHEHDHDDEPAETTETPDTSPRKRAKADKPDTKPKPADGTKVYDCPDWYDYEGSPVKVFCFLCNAWFDSGLHGVKDSHNFKSRGLGTTCSTKNRTLSEEEESVVALTTNVKVKIIQKLGDRKIVPKPWSCEAAFKLIKDVVEFMITNSLDMDQWSYVHITGDDGEFPRTPHYKITVKEPKTKKHAALEHFEE